MEKEINKVISEMSVGQRKYETKQSIKKGFKNLKDYVKYKIENQTENKIKKETSERLAIERKFWKKTQGDMWTQFKGTPIGDIPFFDINYWTNLNPNYVKGVSTMTSKEMMEYFLTSISQYDADKLNDIPICTNSGKTLTYKTLMFLAWDNLLDIDSSKSGDVQFRNYEPFKWFNELEHLIENDELFYALLQKVWLFGSHLLTNKEEMFSRFGRSKISFKKRMEYADYLANLNEGYMHDGMRPDALIMELDQYGEEDFVPIYRTFSVRKGKVVRVSNKKYLENGKYNPDYFLQDEGKGWSFTTDKTIATRLGWNINTHHLMKYAGYDKKTALKNLVRKKFITTSMKKDPRYFEGHYRCVGKYFVKKKDILLFTDERKEREIIVNPNNVILHGYYFLNAIDNFTLKMVVGIDDSVSEEVQKTTVSDFDSFSRNIDVLYNAVRPVVSDYFKENPEDFIECFKNGFWHGGDKDIGNKVLKRFVKTYNIKSYAKDYYKFGKSKLRFLYYLDNDNNVFTFDTKGKEYFRNPKKFLEKKIVGNLGKCA